MDKIKEIIFGKKDIEQEPTKDAEAIEIKTCFNCEDSGLNCNVCGKGKDICGRPF